MESIAGEKSITTPTRRQVTGTRLRSIPWAYGVSPNKDRFSIGQMFFEIKAKIRYHFKIDWNPEYFYVDFEGDKHFRFSF